jgi:uncharacterized membrane protein YdjX (TVP38/TMEM64 family)
MNPRTAKKLALLAVLATLAVLFFVFDMQQYLELRYLQEQGERFRLLFERHTPLVVIVYFLLYVLVVALNLPGAVVMTLAGGMLLGFWIGLVVVSFASTIGATLACMFSRYLLRDWVRKSFGDKLERVNKGVDEEGAFYLFTMRLIPAIPFFVINLVMGLTPMRLRTFFWVSQLGMLPGTAVFVNAGTQLGQITALGDILSWRLLLSFALLGMFPLAAKRIIQAWRGRKGLAKQPPGAP